MLANSGRNSVGEPIHPARGADAATSIRTNLHLRPARGIRSLGIGYRGNRYLEYGNVSIKIEPCDRIIAYPRLLSQLIAH